MRSPYMRRCSRTRTAPCRRDAVASAASASTAAVTAVTAAMAAMAAAARACGLAPTGGVRCASALAFGRSAVRATHSGSGRLSVQRGRPLPCQSTFAVCALARAGRSFFSQRLFLGRAHQVRVGFSPLSFFALSLWCAQSSVRSVFGALCLSTRSSSSALVLCTRPLRSSSALVLCARPVRSSSALVRCARPVRSPLALFSSTCRTRVGRLSDR